MYTNGSAASHAVTPAATAATTANGGDQRNYQQAGKDVVRGVDIPGGRVFPDGVVRYIVEVRGSEASWLIAKRYSQFEQLHLTLIQQFLDLGQSTGRTHSCRICHYVPAHSLLSVCVRSVHSPPGSLPDLPPKKLRLFQSHSSPEFIEKRAVLLTNYLRKLIDNKKLANSKLVHEFFTSDTFTDTTLHSHSTPAPPSIATTSTYTSAALPLPSSTSFTLSSPSSAPSTASSSPTSPSAFLSASPPGTPTSSSHFRLPPDSEITTLSIPTHRLVNGTVLYAIHCHSAHRPAQLAHWTQLKRFSQLVDMDDRLRASLFTTGCDEAERKRRLDRLPQRPAKRVSMGSGSGGGSVEDRGLIEERRVLMEHYLRQLLCDDECRKNKHLLDFLGVEG